MAMNPDEYSTRNASIPVGKLPAHLLEELLKRYGQTDDPRVVLGPAVGEDAAIIDMGDRYLVAKTDPITFATDEIGWYAVHVNANDVACCGAKPRWYLATVLLPERGTTFGLADTIFAQIDRACRQLGISLCGGHTEITHDLDRPIVVGQMLGEVDPKRYLTTAGAQIGNVLILTKGIAVEGTAIIAKEKRDQLQGLVSDAELERLANFLHLPGISVVKEAQVAMEVGGVRALHDPTEGGIATGLRELARASGVGLVIDQQQLPVLPECDTLCKFFGLQPLGLIASGSLLMAVEPGQAEEIVGRIQSEGIAATVIGSVVSAAEGCSLRSVNGSLSPLPSFPRDEITRLFKS